MAPIRGFFVWGGGALLILIPFYLFALLGWPAHPDSCTNINAAGVQVPPVVDGRPDWAHADSCYCEAFRIEDVYNGAPGIRQKVNTYSNYYALFTSLAVVFLIRRDRKKVIDGESTVRNVFYNSGSWVPEVWVFAVLFLGLGSMWFHASLSSTVSWFDGMSMYVFASFLPVITVRRRFDIGVFFYCAYAVLVIVFTMLNRILDDVPLISMKLIGSLVGLYFLTELALQIYDMIRLGGPSAWWDQVKTDWRDGWSKRATIFWWVGAGCFGLATMFQILSQTGGPLCSATSGFQPHGLLWHTLSGAMAVLLYFYWREQPDEAMRARFASASSS
ncbi:MULTISPECIES: ceramidase domain-containing protein [unclassified Caulobacter]|uniref:ceramidase domain-containing protein n=1 Tax=unclassified Caulobacter TaxID=2648921 RepID=UPI00068BAEB5|nr:ceramidase domain-containing protein [Caulobacter sp. UNC358MFTsu5.1]